MCIIIDEFIIIIMKGPDRGKILYLSPRCARRNIIPALYAAELPYRKRVHGAQLLAK